ncbi:unnamed protein product, partial [Mesorhabditis spiculigera]
MTIGWAPILALVLMQVTGDDEREGSSESEMQESDAKKKEKKAGCSKEKKEGKPKVEIKQDMMSKYNNTHHQPSVSTQKTAHPLPRPRMLIMFHRTLKQYAVTLETIHHLLLVRPWAFGFVSRPYTLTFLPIQNCSLTMHRAAMVLLPFTIPELPHFVYTSMPPQELGEETSPRDGNDESGGTSYTPVLLPPTGRQPQGRHRAEPVAPSYSDLGLPAEVPECYVCDSEPGTLVLLQQRIGVKCLNARNYYLQKPLEKRAHKKKCPHKDFDSSQLPTDPELPRTTLRESAATGCGFCRVLVIQQLQVSFAIY